jgi:hypothetical protein
MKKREIEKFEDKLYVLKRKSKPLSFILPSRNTSRYSLLYFDGETGINRALRYAKNQKSPFEDEQDGTAILEPIVFVDGALKVPKTNQVLQKFLSLHPSNGVLFEEVNSEKDATSEIEKINYELDAMVTARDLPVEKLETVARVLIGSKVDRMTTHELKRDVLVYAKRNPKDFLEMLSDPMLDLQNTCAKLLDNNVLALRNKGRDIYYNLPDNKKKLLTVPYGEDPVYILASFMQSDEGLEVLRLLEQKM